MKASAKKGLKERLLDWLFANLRIEVGNAKDVYMKAALSFNNGGEQESAVFTSIPRLSL